MKLEHGIGFYKNRHRLRCFFSQTHQIGSNPNRRCPCPATAPSSDACTTSGDSSSSTVTTGEFATLSSFLSAVFCANGDGFVIFPLTASNSGDFGFLLSSHNHPTTSCRRATSLGGRDHRERQQGLLLGSYPSVQAVTFSSGKFPPPSCFFPDV